MKDALLVVNTREVKTIQCTMNGQYLMKISTPSVSITSSSAIWPLGYHHCIIEHAQSLDPDKNLKGLLPGMFQHQYQAGHSSEQDQVTETKVGNLSRSIFTSNLHF